VIDGTRYFWLDDDQMVAMRYARNLAHGFGPVWNVGERVEGYTSTGWMLVMAAVHLLPLSDATTSLVVKFVNWVLACWLVVLSDRLLRSAVPRPGLARPAVLVALVLSFDLLFWSVNGFETTLLTVLFVWSLWRVFQDETPRPLTTLLMGCLPVARSDAYHLLAVVILVAAVRWHRVPGAWSRLALAGVLPVAHLAFRVLYYGDWLPNTYYLKVDGVAGLAASGLRELSAFASTYVVALVMAAAGAWWAGDRRRQALAIATGVTAIHMVSVGADVFDYFRFLAPWVPVVLVMAGATSADVGQVSSRAGALLAAVLFAATTTSAGVHGRAGLRQLVAVNGEPEYGTVVGVMIRDATAADARVAVVAAGAVPYFSRRAAIDLLGKTDARVAHLPPHPGAPVGHAKYDIDGSLASRPDVLVPLWRETWTVDTATGERTLVPEALSNYARAIAASRAFAADYRDQPVRLPYLSDHSAVYIRRDSAERGRMDRWRVPRLEH